MGSPTTKNHLEMSAPSLSPSGKTKSWPILNTTLGEHLGYIRWHGPWRKYVFVPSAVLIMDAACATQIAGFLDTAMADYKASKSDRGRTDG